RFCMQRLMSRWALTVVTLLCLSVPGIGYSATVQETPSPLAMTGDALFARPVLIATTVVGAAVYIVSLPFSLLGGNAGEAGEVLVLGPAKAAFWRCLGCARDGRREDVVTLEGTE